jgi:hypothetical protein
MRWISPRMAQSLEVRRMCFRVSRSIKCKIAHLSSPGSELRLDVQRASAIMGFHGEWSLGVIVRYDLIAVY